MALEPPYHDNVSRAKYVYNRSNINRYNTKYKQLSLESIHPFNDNKNEMKSYSYGVRFYYAKNCRDDNAYFDHILVQRKYKSLKEELLNNELSVLSPRQFDNEYIKALINYDSDYCKSKYRPYDNRHNININHILSMMIYCNYTVLQYEFSKTYRDNIHQHNNFYHLGRFLKQSVHIFGQRISDGNIRKFYHGITEQMVFPSYINNVCIRCPLSTSSDFDVASRFTNGNGIVIEFGGNNTKYISMEWLSDFPNEHECLFIQNDDNYPLIIENIIQTSDGIEYEMVLQALRGLHEIMYLKKEKQGLETFSSDIIALIASMIERQLVTDQDQKINFNEYSENIIDTYFDNQKAIYVDIEQNIKEVWKDYGGVLKGYNSFSVSFESRRKYIGICIFIFCPVAIDSSGHRRRFPAKWTINACFWTYDEYLSETFDFDDLMEMEYCGISEGYDVGWLFATQLCAIAV